MLPTARHHFFERSCVARAQSYGDWLRKLRYTRRRNAASITKDLIRAFTNNNTRLSFKPATYFDQETQLYT